MKLEDQITDGPLLAQLSKQRVGEASPLPGHYDKNNDVWVIKRKNEYVPLVEIEHQNLGLLTKTMVNEERDDSWPNELFQLSTKTEVQLERDDISGTKIMELLQLSTKTAIQSERDD